MCAQREYDKTRAGGDAEREGCGDTDLSSRHFSGNPLDISPLLRDFSGSSGSAGGNQQTMKASPEAPGAG